MSPALGFRAGLFFSALLFFYQIGAVPFFDLDEAIYAETSREMIETGNWLTPQYNYTPVFDKPVLLYWAMAMGFKLFGMSEISGRLVSAVAGLGLLGVVFGLTQTVWGNPAAILALLFLATSLEILILVHAALTDMLLVFFISAALASFYMVYLRRGGFWWVGIYLSMALAVLTKGPVGLVLPAAVIGLFILTVGPAREALKNIRPVWGSVLFAAAAFPWYAVMIGIHGEAFADSFFLKHNVERFRSAIGGHAGTPFYYLGVIAVGFFPWAAFLPGSLERIFEGRWKFFRRNISEHPFDWFLFLWCAVVVGFFTLAGTKLPNYIAPAFPPMAILAAGWWARKIQGGYSRGDRGIWFSHGWMVFSAVALAGMLLSIPAAVEWARLRFGEAAPFLGQPIAFGSVLFGLSGVLAAGVLAYFFALAFGRLRAAPWILILTMGLFDFLALGGLLPRISAYVQAPLRNLAVESRNWIGPEDPLVVFGLKKPSILFYAGRGAVVFRSERGEDLRAFLADQPRAAVVAPAHLGRGLLDLPGLRIRKEEGGYVLATSF